MAKSGPSLVFRNDSKAVSAEIVALICDNPEIHMLNIVHKTMNVQQMRDLTARISDGIKINNLNIKLKEHSGERGFALAVRNLAEAILASGSIKGCSLHILTLAFELECSTKTELGQKFKEVPEEKVLLDFATSEGAELVEDQEEQGALYDVSEALGELSTTVAALPGQAAGGLFNLYQQMGNLQLGSFVPSLPSCVSSCMPVDEQEQEQRRDKKFK